MERKSIIVIAAGGAILSFLGIVVCQITGICQPFWGGFLPAVIAGFILCAVWKKEPSKCECGSGEFTPASNAEAVALYQEVSSI